MVSAYGSRKVFIFDKLDNGSWSKDAFVAIDQYTSESDFGYSLSIYNQMLLVGARGANRAYLFDNIQNVSNVFVIDDFEDHTGFGNDVVLSNTDIAIASSIQSKVYLFTIGYDPPTSSPTPIPTQNPTMLPTVNPTQIPTIFPTVYPTQIPTIVTEKYVFSSAPTSSPTTSIAIHNLTNNDGMTNYMVIMGISLALVTTIILSMFYIIYKYKKYKSVNVEEILLPPDNFTSVYNMEREGWNKTVHPIHLQYDSDEESQTIAPIHEKYKQTALLPV